MHTGATVSSRVQLPLGLRHFLLGQDRSRSALGDVAGPAAEDVLVDVEVGIPLRKAGKSCVVNIPGTHPPALAEFSEAVSRPVDQGPCTLGALVHSFSDLQPQALDLCEVVVVRRLPLVHQAATEDADVGGEPSRLPKLLRLDPQGGVGVEAGEVGAHGGGVKQVHVGVRADQWRGSHTPPA
eukprot:CAMPEP_0175756102 /NCGR_PEP_ID=MMETSP0097-20121207/63751_1 /TAXON_ID=311494 /ORGANISM="Alexandrium monilatum, Strain CCMP3105" /LENGTH=181 /DNA_ID=CAMNT_0017065195 /DNA_START=15 /DNA_END=560 /DNA_ORIENTATION=+